MKRRTIHLNLTEYFDEFEKKLKNLTIGGRKNLVLRLLTTTNPDFWYKFSKPVQC